jgi:hypothetical protein
MKPLDWIVLILLQIVCTTLAFGFFRRLTTHAVSSTILAICVPMLGILCVVRKSSDYLFEYLWAYMVLGLLMLFITVALKKTDG